MKHVSHSLYEAFKANKADILNGIYSGFLTKDFHDFSVHDEGNGSKVITLSYTEAGQKNAPPSAKHVDIFILQKSCELGEHFHKNATAQIKVINGQGTATIEQEKQRFTVHSELTFPANSIHNVKADDAEPVVFISYQDNPILQDDGTLDYYKPKANKP